MNEAFEELEDGNEDALKEVLERQKAQLRCGLPGSRDGSAGGRQQGLVGEKAGVALAESTSH